MYSTFATTSFPTLCNLLFYFFSSSIVFGVNQSLWIRPQAYRVNTASFLCTWRSHIMRPIKYSPNLRETHLKSTQPAWTQNPSKSTWDQPKFHIYMGPSRIPSNLCGTNQEFYLIYVGSTKILNGPTKNKLVCLNSKSLQIYIGSIKNSSQFM